MRGALTSPAALPILIAMKKQKWWQEGVRFECQGSGKCCVSHGGYGYVWLTKEDRRRMAAHLGMTPALFTKTYCEKENDIWKLKDGPTAACPFLRDRKCGVYEARPTQCRTWPFWPEVMEARRWNQEVASFCPGVGKGRTWTREEIEAQLVDQMASESTYGS